MLFRKEKSYKYLLCYSFSHKVGDKLQYTEGGTGRIILDLSREIRNYKDICDVENILKEQSSIDNLINISLLSFSKLDNN